jgi:hypothetical protein
VSTLNHIVVRVAVKGNIGASLETSKLKYSSTTVLLIRTVSRNIICYIINTRMEVQDIQDSGEIQRIGLRLMGWSLYRGV